MQLSMWSVRGKFRQKARAGTHALQMGSFHFWGVRCSANVSGIGSSTAMLHLPALTHIDAPV